MATLISPPRTRGTVVPSGERRFAQRLETLLEDDYLCWYDVPVGASQRRPDFIVLHPRRGLLVLEVKDWKLDTIQSITRTSVTLRTERGLKTVANPLEQARQYAHVIVDLLARDPALVAPPGTPHAGKLAFPYGHGVVLANITRARFERTDLGEVLAPELVICQDEMTESADPEAFQARLWQMFRQAFRTVLTLPQIDRIRWHLFPEIRVEPGSGELFPARAVEPLRDVLAVFDLQQEQLARSLGEGHRVIHGVAGSGKTMILAFRSTWLAERLERPILVLCYNRALAARLAELIGARPGSERVVVRTFHGWCADQLRSYHVPAPTLEGPEYWPALAQAVVDGVERGQIPRAQYGAVLVDEGHDFEEGWLKLVVQMVDPAVGSFLLLYDDAQSLYGERRRRSVTFSKLGIQARGRTTILRLNYRNTREVLGLAYAFAEETMRAEDADEDGVPLVRPHAAGRSGPVPELVTLHSVDQEATFVADRIRQLHEAGRAWRQIAVLFHDRWTGDRIERVLGEFGVPVRRHGRGLVPRHDGVALLTMHSSKGLEFPAVIVAGIAARWLGENEVEATRLLYVAMTRATETLVVTAHGSCRLMDRLMRAQADAGEPLAEVS